MLLVEMSNGPISMARDNGCSDYLDTSFLLTVMLWSRKLSIAVSQYCTHPIRVYGNNEHLFISFKKIDEIFSA